MANSSEIADISAINKELTQLNATINSTAESCLRVVKAGGDLINVTKTMALTSENLNKAQKETTETTKQLDAIGKQLVASEQKLKDTEDGRMKTIIENRVATQAATQAIKDKVKAEQAEEGSLVRMRERLKELTAQYDKAGTRTKAMTNEINNLSKEIGKAEEATNRGQRSVGQYGKMWDGLKGLLPIVSVAAIGAAIVGTFKSIIGSTQATADAFQFAMSGMSKGLDFFWKTLATGNWSNFFENLGKAISGGYAYAKMLDEVADNNRALRIIESNARGEELRLEEALKNKQLSTADRLQAGKDRIALEEKLSRDRQKIADKNFEAELNETMRQTGLSKDRLMSISKDFDSEKLLMANQYNEALKFQESRRVNKTAEEYAKFIPILKNTTEDIKDYAASIRGYDVATEEQQNKFVAAVIQRNEAINSAPENLKKVITRVNGLMAESTVINQKAAIKSVETAKNVADEKIKQEERAAYATTGLQEMTAKDTLVIKEDGLKSNQNFLDAQLKQAEEEAEKEKQLQEDIKQAKIDLAVEAGNAIFEFRNMALQKELNALQVEKDAKLANSKLTTEQRAAIEADYEKKSNAIKAKQAKNDKLQALFNIAINTAVAISKASPIIPLMILAGISGAIQAALVAAQPIPKYAKGTKSAADRFIAGEAGRELMQLRSGELALADKPTFFEGSRFKGARVFSNPETERIMGASDRGIGGQSISDVRIIAGLEKLNTTLKNKPVLIQDKENRIIGQEMGTHKEYYLNRLTR